MIKVESEVEIYELDRRETKMIDGPKLIVQSHWNLDYMVILKFGDGPSITVSAKDLLAAIHNATNSARF